MKKTIVTLIICCLAITQSWQSVHASMIDDLTTQGQDIIKNVSEKTAKDVTETLTQRASEWLSKVGQNITDWFKQSPEAAKEKITALKAEFAALKEKLGTKETDNLIDQIKGNVQPEVAQKLDQLKEHIRMFKEDALATISKLMDKTETK